MIVVAFRKNYKLNIFLIIIVVISIAFAGFFPLFKDKIANSNQTEKISVTGMASKCIGDSCKDSDINKDLINPKQYQPPNGKAKEQLSENSAKAPDEVKNNQAPTQFVPAIGGGGGGGGGGSEIRSGSSSSGDSSSNSAPTDQGSSSDNRNSNEEKSGNLNKNQLSQNAKHGQFNFDNLKITRPFAKISHDAVFSNNALEEVAKVSGAGYPNVGVSDMKIARTIDEKTEDNTFSYKFYDQYYKGIKVHGGSAGFVVVDDVLVKTLTNYYPNINIDTKPKITEEDALINGNKYLNLDIDKSENSELVVYPLSQENYMLAWKIDIPIIADQPSKYTIIVDANNGKVLEYYDNLIYDTLSGTITGKVYPKSWSDALVDVPFKDENVSVLNKFNYTNSSGKYELKDINGIVSLKSNLSGPWVKVLNYLGYSNASHNFSTAVPAIHNWNWYEFDNSYAKEESNLFYNTNKVHDFFLEPNLNVTEMNYQAKATVQVPGVCNAFSDGTNIYFFGAVGPCNSTALMSSVIHHEYTHGVVAHVIFIPFPYSDQTGNMNEGWADYFACSLLNDSCVGQGFFISQPNGCLRRCNTTNRFPDNYNPEPHSGAEIFSGAQWHIREVLGKEYTDRLSIQAMRMQPTSFANYLDDYLTADDNNANLNDGTPNINTICHSFSDIHGIASLNCINHTQKPIGIIDNPKVNEIIPKNILISVNGTAIQSTNGTFSFYKVSLFNGSSNLLINESTVPVVHSTLAKLNTSNLSPGSYKLKLEVADTIGVFTTSIDFVIIEFRPAVFCTQSPCVAGSNLTKSRDSIINLSFEPAPEPNQPNTIDSCLDGRFGIYMSDESLENITVTGLNGSTFRPGDSVLVEAWAHCWPGSPSSDHLNFVYSNNSNLLNDAYKNPFWKVKAVYPNCPAPGFQKLTRNFTLDNVEGKHTIRGLFRFQGSNTSTCSLGLFDDHDDVTFLVSSQQPTPPPTPTSESNFTIRDSSGSRVALFDNQGNLVLKGILEQNSNFQKTSNFAFSIRNNGNDVLIVENNGSMYIDGMLFQNQSSLNSPDTNNDFRIKNNGNLVAFVNQSGFIFLKGNLTQNGNP